MKKHRVMMLIEEGLVPPESVEGMTDEQVAPFKAEWDVYSTLRGLGHEVHKLELKEDLGVVREAVHAFKPHVVFNIVEGYRNVHVFDQHVVSYLELIDQRYTGCNPRGLTLARDKALTKKIMAYHRIRVPAFAVFPRRRSSIVCPKKLSFPLFVKSISVEGSIGISKQSLVYDEAALKERVQYIHDSLETHAIAEQYIDGRELYVGVMGNLRLQTLPAWELVMKNGDADEPLIATRKAKFDPKYQKLMGVTSRKADALPEEVVKQMPHLCKRIYRILGLTGYARLDFRMTDAGELYLLEANPNPQIAKNEDFADSAEAAGVSYPQLIQQVLTLGMGYRPEILF